MEKKYITDSKTTIRVSNELLDLINKYKLHSKSSWEEAIYMLLVEKGDIKE